MEISFVDQTIQLEQFGFHGFENHVHVHVGAFGGGTESGVQGCIVNVAAGELQFRQSVRNPVRRAAGPRDSSRHPIAGKLFPRAAAERDGAAPVMVRTPLGISSM
ncbi:MAG: hypothetical protein ACREIF_09885 [Chthoniobacterales bacterium]